MKSWDWCPYCRGSLDTGWECNECGEDLLPYAYPWWARLRDKIKRLFL